MEVLYELNPELVSKFVLKLNSKLSANDNLNVIDVNTIEEDGF
jgi:hypothetical protein